jgi:hypothetical protein
VVLLKLLFASHFLLVAQNLPFCNTKLTHNHEYRREEQPFGSNC